MELTDGCYSEGDSQGLPGFIHPRVLRIPTISFQCKLYSHSAYYPKDKVFQIFFESPNFPKILTPRSSLSNASRLKGRTVVSLTNSQICGFDLNFIFFLVPKFPANPHAVFDVLTKNSPLTCEYQHESVLDRVSLLHQATNGRFQKYRKRCRFNEITNNEITKSEGLL